jgi:glycerol dehydrogenase
METMSGTTKNAMDFFNTGFAVFGAPSRYIQGPGIIDLVGPCCATLASTAILLCDDTVATIVETPISTSCAKVGVKLSRINFNGQINAGTGPALAADITSRGQPPIIIAAGGGRTIDAGKALRDEIGGALLTLPTVASNDAPTSKNYVFYDDDHRLLEVRHMPRNPDFVVVDTTIISAAPKAFFLTGLGDAIAKKFEADCCMAAGGRTMFGARSTRTANAIANECYRQLIENAASACEIAGSGQPNGAFDAAIEAMILMAGLGFESGGLSISHALTRGLSHVKVAKTAPHGLQVAYGLLVQLQLEGNGFPPELLGLYQATGLPMSLSALGVTDPGHPVFSIIAEPSAQASHIRNFSRPITVDHLVEAMAAIESRFGKPAAIRAGACVQ